MTEPLRTCQDAAAQVAGTEEGRQATGNPPGPVLAAGA